MTKQSLLTLMCHVHPSTVVPFWLVSLWSVPFVLCHFGSCHFGDKCQSSQFLTSCLIRCSHIPALMAQICFFNSTSHRVLLRIEYIICLGEFICLFIQTMCLLVVGSRSCGIIPSTAAPRNTAPATTTTTTQDCRIKSES